MTYDVMIVDDDKSIRIAVEALFESEGINVIAAESADDCIQKLEKGFKGVILMDIMMPVKDGWDAIRAIIEKNLFKKGMIVVMLTAKDVPDEKMLGLQEYITDYITKPFDPDALVANVKEYFSYIKK